MEWLQLLLARVTRERDELRRRDAAPAPAAPAAAAAGATGRGAGPAAAAAAGAYGRRQQAAVGGPGALGNLRVTRGRRLQVGWSFG